MRRLMRNSCFFSNFNPGEIFGGINVVSESNDTEFFMQSLGKCCSCISHEDDGSSCFPGGIRNSYVPELLSRIKGPWALIYWQNCSNTLWFGRDVFGRRGLIVHWSSLLDSRLLFSSVSPATSLYLIGFLFIVFMILMVTCAEITIVLCYFQLCSEDYHWWWRAYLTAGSSALYLFLYSIFYFFTKLQITKVVSGILYFGYMLIASYAFFVLTGTIGLYSCFWFVRKIYSSVKIDKCKNEMK